VAGTKDAEVRINMKTERISLISGCTDGCSRRALLHGLGVVAVGTLVVAAGCAQQGSSLSTATSASCGAGICIDLSDASNKELSAAGGAMLVDMTNDTVMVVRVSDTQVVALSAICTHAGCSMDYVASQALVNCPCHGSQFSTAGNVLRGPANRALRVYTATLANNMVTIS
jgi:cytochrome b6-f complex iron-sulfur subunit